MNCNLIFNSHACYSLQKERFLNEAGRPSPRPVPQPSKPDDPLLLREADVDVANETRKELDRFDRENMIMEEEDDFSGPKHVVYVDGEMQHV